MTETRAGRISASRLEAFSDGVLAIIITIMVLELRPPEEPAFHALRAMLPVFLAYALSFVMVAIYWNNHHHLLRATESISGAVMWANMHLLFWLSLVPFCTGWMGENHFAPHTVALYGVVLLMAAIAYYILQSLIIRAQGPGSLLRKAVGGDWKGKLSPVLYLAAVALAFKAPWASLGIYALVALTWLIPDRRIERVLGAGG
jgi:uncharacterized membrane protein